MNKDVFIKDEGDFVTIGFQTEKAKQVLKKEKNMTNVYGDELPKLDILNEFIITIKIWCNFNKLTYEEC